MIGYVIVGAICLFLGYYGGNVIFRAKFNAGILMKKRKVKCPECKGLGVINKATPVFIGMYLTAYHSETHRCLHCDGS